MHHSCKTRQTHRCRPSFQQGIDASRACRTACKHIVDKDHCTACNFRPRVLACDNCTFQRAPALLLTQPSQTGSGLAAQKPVHKQISISAFGKIGCKHCSLIEPAFPYAPAVQRNRDKQRISIAVGRWRNSGGEQSPQERGKSNLSAMFIGQDQLARCIVIYRCRDHTGMTRGVVDASKALLEFGDCGAAHRSLAGAARWLTWNFEFAPAFWAQPVLLCQRIPANGASWRVNQINDRFQTVLYDCAKLRPATHEFEPAPLARPVQARQWSEP